jgi:hypothetical protein
MPGLTVCTFEIGSFGLEAEELAVSITNPLDTQIADIGADIAFRRSGPIGDMRQQTNSGSLRDDYF